ncbi:hypothetical protein C8R42DRAFT_728884 [Lentinula raphanica]|nr:hypothetical protein C8R42DRAFT_728884 [Lentinula raphanica]
MLYFFARRPTPRSLSNSGFPEDVNPDTHFTVSRGVLSFLNLFSFTPVHSINAAMIRDLCYAIASDNPILPAFADNEPWVDSELLSCIGIYQQRPHTSTTCRSLPSSTSLFVSFAISASPRHAVNALAVYLMHHTSMLFHDTNGAARVVALAFQYSFQTGVVGFIAYSGVSDTYFGRLLDTPWFDIYGAIPDTFVYIEPANHPSFGSHTFKADLLQMST